MLSNFGQFGPPDLMSVLWTEDDQLLRDPHHHATALPKTQDQQA